MSLQGETFYDKAPPDQGAFPFIYPPTGANLTFFAEALRHHCLVAIPTETVYGLAGSATDPLACRAIFSVKGRPLMDPLIVHIGESSQLAHLAEIPSGLEKLVERFWPGPLTLVLKKKPIVPDIVTAGRDTVAVRMPRHPVAQALLHQFGEPLAAPSANPFGYVSPTRPEHVSHSFGNRVPFILDGGPCEIGVESTILEVTDPLHPKLLRRGAIPTRGIEDCLGSLIDLTHDNDQEHSPAKAPGRFPKHYSPKARLVLFPEGNQVQARSEGSALLLLKRPSGQTNDPDVFWFSEDGNPQEIARSLYTLLRQLDTAGFSQIYCELPDPSADSLMEAIRDRLRRASA